jgi:hypothetical protein
MELTAEMTRYLAWAGVVLFGALSAVVERRWIGRPWLGLLFLAGIGGGLVIMQVSPFSFGGGSYYMEGVLISGAAGLALIGYVCAYVLAVSWQLACRLRGRRARP